MRKSGQTRRAAASWFVALALALFPMAMPSPVSASTTIKVTTRADTLARDGRCSLREAIRAANLNRAVSGCPAGSGADTIVLPAGHYTLMIPGRYEDAGLTGDLDIRSNLTIRGVSAAKTVIDGNELDRVFDVSRGSSVHLDRLTVMRGATASYPSCEHLRSDGGGILNGGRLLVTASVVTANRIGECGGNDGGGISSSGTLTVRGTTISANSAFGSGGGISSSGDAFLIRDRIIGNLADPFDYQRAAGVDSTGYLVLSRSLVANNVGSQEWGMGGVSMAAGIISDSTIRDNASGECGSGGVFMVGAQMIRSTVSGNLATDDNCGGDGAGGVMAINSEIVNSTISGNPGSVWSGGRHLLRRINHRKQHDHREHHPGIARCRWDVSRWLACAGRQSDGSSGTPSSPAISVRRASPRIATES